jgi:hypothetical protein
MVEYGLHSNVSKLSCTLWLQYLDISPRGLLLTLQEHLIVIKFDGQDWLLLLPPVSYQQHHHQQQQLTCSSGSSSSIHTSCSAHSHSRTTPLLGCKCCTHQFVFVLRAAACRLSRAPLADMQQQQV